jgi:aromatic ring-cleaving dioxygenase
MEFFTEIAQQTEVKKVHKRQQTMSRALIFALLAVLYITTIVTSQKVSGYDLHVYFFPNNQQSKGYADNLVQQAQKQWSSLRIKMFDAPIGPHPLPMFEIDIPQNFSGFSDIVSWIMVNRGNCSVLLHPHTDDEIRDHTLSATWIGTPVPLDFGKL